ncbi:replication factor-A protein 1 [Pavlovales sp. CCMP2436]|nr:replication factor-A protein 1 [Pavlovales sp. CCMP2436]
MAEQLTPGCTLAIRNNTAERGQIVQVIDVRRLQAAAGAAPGADRYRIVVSDGTYFQPGMVSTQLHELVSTLQINAVIRLDNWSLNNVGGRVIVIVLALTIIHPNCGERIGTPVSIEQVGESGGNGGGQPYPQQGQGAQQQQPPDQAQQQAQFGNGGYGAPQQQQANNAYGQPQQQQQPYGYGVPQQQQQQYAPQPPQMNSYGQALQQGNPYEQHGGPQMGQQQQGYGQQQQQPPQQGYGGGAAYGGGGGYGQDNSNNNNNNNNGGYGGAVEGAQWQQQPPQQQQQQQGGYGGGGYGGGGGGGGGYGGGDQGGGNGGAGYFNGGGNGPVHRQAEDAVTMPIPALNPYQNRWAIKGRITAKGSKKQYTNAKGEGTLFSFTVCDNDGDIRLTCFNEAILRVVHC